MALRTTQSSSLHLFRRSLILIIGVVFLGAAGFYYIETHGGMDVQPKDKIFGPPQNFIDALYWAIETLTTTGYGDIVPTSRIGRIFVMIFSVVGVFTIAWAGAHALAFIVEGHLSQAVRERKMSKEIQSLEGHYVICGLGRVGMEVVREFRSSPYDYVVIDKSKENLESYLKEDELYVCGDTEQDEVLKAARIETARGLVACFPSDADNVFTILTAKGLNPNLFVIARGQQEMSRSKLLRAGADRVVLPSHIGGVRMAAMALRPVIVDFLDQTFQVSGDREPMLIEEITVEEGNPFIGILLKDTQIKSLTEVMVLGIKPHTGGFLLNPPSNTVISGGDILIGLGDRSHFQKLRELISRPK